MSEGEEGWGKGREGKPWGIVAEPGPSGRIETFEDLRVWQDAQVLVDAVYRLTQPFPSEEQFGLTNQLRRAAVSIPSDIAEGWGRGSRKDYIRFLRTARGSLYEVKTQLVIAGRIGLARGSSHEDTLALCEPLRHQLQGLISALERPGT